MRVQVQVGQTENIQSRVVNKAVQGQELYIGKGSKLDVLIHQVKGSLVSTTEFLLGQELFSKVLLAVGPISDRLRIKGFLVI